MKMIQSVLLFLGILLMCCSCGKGASNSGEMGRYTETAVELPSSSAFYAVQQDEKVIRLAVADGADLVSVDGGETFGKDAGTPDVYTQMKNRPVYSMSAAPQGGWLVTRYTDDWGSTLVGADGQTMEITGLDGNVVLSCYGGGYFYACKDDGVFQVDAATGEAVFLWEPTGLPSYMAADDKRLYMLYPGEGLRMYDLEKRELSAQQDEVLAGFLAGEVQYMKEPGTSSVIVYPYEDGVYVLAHSGLYRHSLYGEDMELLADGSMCRMGEAGGSFSGLVVLEGEEKPDFLVCYADGALMRYVYDASLPAVPEDTLRVYSLYEDGNIRHAVSAFRQAYPGINVRYEVGMVGYGITLDDALKNLATEIAAGTGPDVLVIDDIPYESYVEKGALRDLSPLREKMTEDTYFTEVVDAFAGEGGLYAIPLTFAVPVLCGDREKIAGVESLSDLADLAEEAGSIRKGDTVLGFWDAENALRLLSEASMGAWVEGGAVDREALEEFLTQAKRIYDAEKVDPEERGIYTLWESEYGLVRKFDEDGVEYACGRVALDYLGQPYYVGFVGNVGGGFRQFLGGQNYLDFGYVKMPGQRRGDCLVSSVLAVNQSTAHWENAEVFLEYALSTEFQSESTLNGIPVSKAAFRALQVKPADFFGGTGGVGGRNGSVDWDISWPTEQEFAELTDGITNVNYCDSRVYETVMELGQKALDGEAGIEETADAIIKKVQIYLAE